MNSTTHKKLYNFIYFIIGIILVLVIIQILSFIKNNTIVFPNVFDILIGFFKLFKDGNTYLFIFHSVIELAIALITSAIIGIGLGVIGALNEPFRQIIKPLMIAIRSIPMIVLIFILITLTKSIVIPSLASALVIIPIFYESTKEGILNIDHNLLDLYKLNSNTNVKVVFKVHVPLIMGYTKQAFITAIGLGFKIIITAEYLAGVGESLGFNFYSRYIQPLSFEGIYSYGLLLILLTLVVEAIPHLVGILYRYSSKKRQNKLMKELKY